MRITSKGQVTIPVEIRERVGLLPHTEVVFEVEGDTVRLRKADDQNDGRGERLIRRLRGTAKVELSTDEILAMTRGEE
jgi:AbrB family looped-hinge helix DNA binding protein